MVSFSGTILNFIILKSFNMTINKLIHQLQLLSMIMVVAAIPFVNFLFEGYELVIRSKSFTQLSVK